MRRIVVPDAHREPDGTTPVNERFAAHLRARCAGFGVDDLAAALDRLAQSSGEGAMTVDAHVPREEVA